VLLIFLKKLKMDLHINYDELNKGDEFTIVTEKSYGKYLNEFTPYLGKDASHALLAVSLEARNCGEHGEILELIEKVKESIKNDKYFEILFFVM
jgi:hypothetical protein